MTSLTKSQAFHLISPHALSLSLFYLSLAVSLAVHERRIPKNLLESSSHHHHLLRYCPNTTTTTLHKERWEMHKRFSSSGTKSLTSPCFTLVGRTISSNQANKFNLEASLSLNSSLIAYSSASTLSTAFSGPEGK